jgi:RimJ/RimL family protein N-acetyltransferase
MDLPSFETPRLRIRPLGGNDIEALFAIFGNDEVMRYWSRSAFTDSSEAEELLRDIEAGYASGQLLQLGIEERAAQALVGTCTLHSRQVPSRRGEIGYALAQNAWGKGYMAEALPVFVDYIFDELGLNRLEADIDPNNLASAKVLRNLGFSQEGFCAQRWIVGGQFSDSALYGLLASTWRARRAARN